MFLDRQYFKMYVICSYVAVVYLSGLLNEKKNQEKSLNMSTLNKFCIENGQKGFFLDLFQGWLLTLSSLGFSGFTLE